MKKCTIKKETRDLIGFGLPGTRGRTEEIALFIGLTYEKECLTFTDQKEWDNIYRVIHSYCIRQKTSFRPCQRTNPSGKCFHIWKVKLEKVNKRKNKNLHK
jgi:hypothetical protein